MTMTTQRRRCWKVLAVTNTAELRSPWWWFEYKPGQVKSNRDIIGPSDAEVSDGKINFGIHVYWDRSSAKKNIGPNEVVVPVTCYRRNFVARGMVFDDAVFTKVSLSEDDYYDALNKKLSTV